MKWTSFFVDLDSRRDDMKSQFSKTGAALVALSFGVISALSFAGNAQAAECKGMKKSACERSTSCTWVDGYKTKTGNKVASYCRKASKTTKKTPTKKKAVSKKTPSKKTVSKKTSSSKTKKRTPSKKKK